jgi:protoheme IX farnesyltransferase
MSMSTNEAGATETIIRPVRIGDYLELTKPRVTSLVLVTTLVGFYMGSDAGLTSLVLIHAMLGTGLVAGGASALNQYLERHHDARMLRTRDRPLANHRITESGALVFSIAISLAGTLYLALLTNLMTGMLAATTLLLYVFLYTPLKKRTALATIVGAVPGAAPPVLGWTAAGGQLDGMALALFMIVFLWQLPHFLAIAWVYDEDYLRGGFPHLTITHSGAANASRQIILYCATLVPISILPTTLDITGSTYMFGALVCGLVYLGYGTAVAIFRTPPAARRLLRASVIYLPVLFLLMVVDKSI